MIFHFYKIHIPEYLPLHFLKKELGVLNKFPKKVFLSTVSLNLQTARFSLNETLQNPKNLDQEKGFDSARLTHRFDYARKDDGVLEGTNRRAACTAPMEGMRF